MQRLLLCLLMLAAPLAANDIGVAAPDGNSAWILLEPPPGQGGEGLGEFAGDPGLPTPDVLGRKPVVRPQLELWRYDNETTRNTLETRVAVQGAYLYAVFEIAGEPFVMLSQGGSTPTLVLRARALNVRDAVPPEAVALSCPDFSDAPAVSPDESMIALRVFRASEALLRVYAVKDWKLVAESPVANFSRPVWVDNAALACIATDAPVSRLGLGDGSANPSVLNHNPSPVAGKLLRLDLDGSSLRASELLAGEFPPETFTRALASDAYSGGLILARKDGAEIVVERRAATPGASPFEIARFEHARGITVCGPRVVAAGVRKGVMHLAVMQRWGEIKPPSLPFGPAQMPIRLPVGDRFEINVVATPYYSASGLGGLVNFRRDFECMLEPVANPDYLLSGQPLCLHTIRAITRGLKACDSMRNPRNLVRVSGLARRFAELDAGYSKGIPSTVLAFDMKITLAGEQQKKGTYVEIFHGAGRGGKGRIRTEDNLGGNWLMNSIDGDGTAKGDWVYTCADIKVGTVETKAPARAGKLYDDMVTQLDARRLLMIGNPAAAPQAGGLRFLWRGTRRNLVTGALERVWEYERLGAGGQRATLRFCAEMPLSKDGWVCPHSLAHADVAISLGAQGKLGFSSVTFSHDQSVALPNLTDKTKPDLLLPKQFWLHEWDETGKKYVERAHAVAHSGEIAYPVELVATGKLKPGYYPSPLSVPVIQREAADDMFRLLQRKR